MSIVRRYVKRVLYGVRARAWDVSAHVEWIEGQPYYERQETVDAYDSVAWSAGRTERLSTMRSPVSGALVALMQEKKCGSVLDVGCGAGAFYHLLRESGLDVRYRGIDRAQAQVDRAIRNFGPMFEVRDASLMTVDEFAQFDAIHVYSVFAFMTVAKQLSTIDRMLSSGAWTVIEIGATQRDIEFAPRSCFKHTGKAEIGGRLLLTVVSWPYLREIQDVVDRHPKYEIAWTEGRINAPVLINSLPRDGGALAEPDIRSKRKRASFLPRGKTAKLLTGTIKPRGWQIPSSVMRLTRADQRAGVT
jgi:SAM-dependent methyltransferase